MKRTPRPPLLATHDAARWRDALLAHRAGYTPEWTADDGAGQALAGIVARDLEIQGDGLNAAPSRQQLEFLDRIGASLLPAQSARAPLVFTLLDTATGEATVPAGTRVAAVVAPPPPSVEDAIPASTTALPAPEFFTEHEITAMRGQVAAIHSIEPAGDVYADHSASAATGFAMFDAMGPVPHRLYLGHGELFRFAGSAEIVLTFDFATPPGGDASVPRPLLLDWEYLSQNGWLPLTLVEDRTQRFTRDGKIVLAKFSGPDAKEDLVGDRRSCWIRATVASRVPSARIAADGVVATPEGFELQVEHTRELLPGDEVTIDGASRALIVASTDKILRLDAELDAVRSGDDLRLADALAPLRPDGADQEGALPSVDTIRARVGFSRSDLVADAASLDGFDVDIGKDFYPFGAQPARFASFYVACKDAFSRRDARIELSFDLVDSGTTAGGAVLAFEYFDGTRWRALGPDQQLSDTTKFLTVNHGTNLPKSGTVSFLAPPDWAESEVNSNKQFWLRLRLAAGDYGRPRELSVAPDPADSTKFIVSTVAATLAPPVVAALRIAYVVFTQPVPLEHCLCENDFAIADRSEQAQWPRSAFAPFTPVSDREPALHFGFSARPPAALVSLLIQVAQAAPDAGAQAFTWDYWGRDGWTELSVRDTTSGFMQTGMLQFIGQADAQPRDGLGGALYRIRARLKSGLASQDHVASLGGVWLNAVWAAQGTRIDRDALGTSNGEPDQTFALPPVRARGAAAGAASLVAGDPAQFERALDLPPNGVPVMQGEVVEVREWAGRGDDWQTAVAGVPPERLRFETDPQDATVKTAAWVRWLPRPHLYTSGSADRHYQVERARGVFRFPGAGGLLPPAGAPIVVSYVTGGGVAGNVEAGAIRELRSGVGFVQSVANPLAAGGGAEAESLRSARDRCPQALRHRDRAVSAEDFEWIAREASPEVARARALPLESPAGRGGRGFVGILVVPQSTEAMPMPSPELSARVLAHLRARAPAGIAGGIRIVAPSYLPVGVRAEIRPLRADEAGRVEARVRDRLRRFMHPLSGGRGGRGWDFGGAVHLSDVAALVAATPGVEAVPFLQLMVGSAAHGDSVAVAPDQLVAAGTSQLKLLVPGAPYALA